MYQCYIKFQSLTGAHSAGSILTQARIEWLLIRTPKELSARGCGYAISLQKKDLDVVQSLLHFDNIPFGDIYIKMPDGKMVVKQNDLS